MAKKVFALIGGIASGKSAASEILCSLGAYIIDADVISHELTKCGSQGETRLIKRFPSCVNDGTLDRRKLKELVFNNEKELKALNDITHPLIISEINRLVAGTNGVAVVVMPLPTGLRRYEAVLNVFCPQSKRIERLVKRDNIDMALAEKIISAQMSDEQYEKAADFTFINDGDLMKLSDDIKKWWNIYVEGKNLVNSRGDKHNADGGDGRP